MKSFTLLLTAAVSSASYLPPYYEGTPVSAGVVGGDTRDFMGQQTFRIDFSLKAEVHMP